ncbi:MAG TPA: class I SAM-dependent methyltransferase [Bacteroidales bacterium]|nr:class I SAM-dependent methyltransferase [Bacteroidales bacterium]
MGFSSEWEKTYASNQQIVLWPWNDLVSYIMRYTKPKSSSESVLELGCGSGANIPFFKQLGIKYFGLEGSPTIVKMLKEKFPEFAKNIRVADFTYEIPFEGLFDIVVDRASLTHNDTKSIRSCLSMIHERMKPGASYIGIDWFSTNHSDFLKGKPIGDGFTHDNYSDGQFLGVGKVHFSDKEHIQELFEGFEIKILEEKRIYRAIPSDNHTLSTWNIHAIRK